MKKTALILFVLAVSGCSQFAYKSQPANAVIPNTAVPITLDGSYDLYCRAIVSRDSNVVGTNKQLKVLELYKQSAGTNPGIMGSDNKKIIEIEYLWISARDKIVIYISTVADRYQNRYSNTNLFAGLDHPNGGDFRVFLIGKIEDSAADKFIFYFKDGQHTDNWEIGRNDDELTLLRLAEKRYASYDENFEMNDAIANGVKFKRQPDWQIIFLDKKAQNNASLDPMKGYSFYYLQHGKKFCIYFPFTTTTLLFKDKYVIYRPDRKAN